MPALLCRAPARTCGPTSVQLLPARRAVRSDMPLLVAIFIAGAAITTSAGTLAHRRSWSILGGPMHWGRSAARRFGRARGTLVVVVTGYTVVFFVALSLG